MPMINIENLKENRAVSEAREKLRDDRTRGIVKWVFEIIVTLVFAVLVSGNGWVSPSVLSWSLRRNCKGGRLSGRSGACPEPV